MVLWLISNLFLFFYLKWTTRDRLCLTIIVHYHFIFPSENFFWYSFFSSPFFYQTYQPCFLFFLINQYNILFEHFGTPPEVILRLYQWEAIYSVNRFLFQLWVGRRSRGIVRSIGNQPGSGTPLHKRGERMAPGIVANCHLNWNRIIHNLLVCQVQSEVKKEERRERRKMREKKLINRTQYMESILIF